MLTTGRTNTLNRFVDECTNWYLFSSCGVGVDGALRFSVRLCEVDEEDEEDEKVDNARLAVAGWAAEDELSKGYIKKRNWGKPNSRIPKSTERRFLRDVVASSGFASQEEVGFLALRRILP